MIASTTLLFLFALRTALATGGSLPLCPDSSTATYDYIVVGAGAGGGPVAARLAESGFSVLLVEAGHNVVNVNTTIPAYLPRVLDDPQVELNYTMLEYPPDFEFQSNNSWYPRARALGGSTIHNALVNAVSATVRDFNSLATLFDDKTWSFENMWNYFKRLEHNLYVPPPNMDHGYDGWLKTNVNPTLETVDTQLEDIINTLFSSASLIDDMNTPSTVDSVGVSFGSVTANENHNRSSVHERLLEVHDNGSDRLSFSFDTLATKVLLCTPHHGAQPRAYGVEIAPGAALAVASNFHGKSQLKTKKITVRHEVIISAGVFQSPQLLMLSGIGDQHQLEKHGIKTIVNLPGVGQNLQDHDEVATIWLLKENYTIFEGCTFGSDPAKDPCLAEWTASGHKNVYSFGAALAHMPQKSSAELQEPDIDLYWAPLYFPGFVRGVGEQAASIHNALTAVNLKRHPSSRGFVRLTGSHPQDKLHIQKLQFQSEGGKKDVAIIREGIKNARQIVGHPDIWKHVDKEVFPGPQAQTDEQIERHIYEHVFGHHACCTNKMGSDDDEAAVLDGDFRVRGVSHLRVVDMSSWPKAPGFFPATPTYMISEKAADVIIAAAKKDATFVDQSRPLDEF